MAIDQNDDPIFAYTTWHDLNQSQPHISIRGITIHNIVYAVMSYYHYYNIISAP